MTEITDRQNRLFELFSLAFDRVYGTARPVPTEQEENDRNRRLEEAFAASRLDQLPTSLSERLSNESVSLEIDKIIVSRLTARQTKMGPAKIADALDAYRKPIPTKFGDLENALLRGRPDINDALETLLKISGRRMLEVAFHCCEKAKGPSGEERATDYEEISEKATHAAEALAALIEQLDPKALSDRDLIPPLLSLEVATSKTARAQLERVSGDASAFWRASAAAKMLAEHALIREAYLRKDNKDERKRSHIAFAQPVAEAWTFMTGKTPSKGTAGTPFIDFLQAAWIDVYGNQTKLPAFVGAVRHIDQTALQPGTAPHWLNFETLLLRLDN